MPDVSKKKRTFEVWLDRNVVGDSTITDVVDVPAGVDADEVCGDVLDTLIANNLDTGWREIERPKRGSR